MMSEHGYSNVSIIIPTYNEAEGIENTLKELLSTEGLEEAEIIVVDDGSRDNTYNIVEHLNTVKLLRHRVNRGYGSAIVTGVKACTRDIIVWYDSDGQHRPEDLKKVVSELITKDYDYCIGVRNETSYIDKSRTFGKWILKKIVKMMSTGEETDFNSGLRAFKKTVIEKYLSLLPERFGASTVTTLLMQERSYYGGSVSINVRKRVGKSSVHQLKDGMRTIGLICNVVILFRPMKVFGTLGTIFILLGSIYGIAEALIYGLGVPILAAIVIIFGLQILLFGISVAQTSKMRKENLERP